MIDEKNEKREASPESLALLTELMSIRNMLQIVRDTWRAGKLTNKQADDFYTLAIVCRDFCSNRANLTEPLDYDLTWPTLRSSKGGK